MNYDVFISANFSYKLEKHATWLAIHYKNEFSEEFSINKITELQTEVKSLIERLSKMPRAFETVQNSNPDETRARSIYGGRFRVVWEIHELNKTVYLTDLVDLKYLIIPESFDVEFEE